jgi:hypothetical protein
MKTTAILLLFTGLLYLLSCKKNIPITEPEPYINKDSIADAEKWKTFQLPFSDTVLLMKYQETARFVNGHDTLKITLSNIYDWVSEEGSKTIWGANAKGYISIQLNNGVVYTPKYPLQISRYSEENGNVGITNIGCSFPNDSLNKADIVKFEESATLTF